MAIKSELSKYSFDDLLDEVARRYKGTLADAETTDLVEELTKRDGVDVTLIDPGEMARLRVLGPGVVLTFLD